jgi:gas vesicle protein
MRDRDEKPIIVIEGGDRGGAGPFLLGALLGAGLALLLAPKSGAETQADLKAQAQKLKAAAESRIREAQTQIEARLGEAREDLMDRVDQIKEAVQSGKTSAQEARAELEEKIARSKAAYRAGVDAARTVAKDGHETRAEGEKPEGSS